MFSTEETKDTLLARLTQSGGRWRVRNAMQPILWLCGLVAIPCFAVLGWGTNTSAIILCAVVLCAVVGVALLSFLYLLAYDRDRLQSEEYLIRKQTLELIE